MHFLDYQRARVGRLFVDRQRESQRVAVGIEDANVRAIGDVLIRAGDNELAAGAIEHRWEGERIQYARR